MTGASYIPGTWLGVVRSGTAVLLGPESPAELAGALWELLAARPEPHEVLAAVTSSSGGSLARIPSFGILDFNGPLRVFLRGNLDLSVEQPGGAVALHGRDVTTWNERRFAVPGMCRLDIADGPPEGRPELPLGEGVVLVQALTLGVPSRPAAVEAPVDMENRVAVETPVTVEDPVAVEHPVAVESHGREGSTKTAASATSTDDAEPADPPGINLLPRPAASAETELAVLDEGQDARQADSEPVPADAGTVTDPDATIAPGVVIDGAAASASVDDPGQTMGPEWTPADPPATGPEPAHAAPAADMTTSYDHLWDRTVMRNIEDAAVREDPDADSGLVAPHHQPALTAAEQRPALGAAEDAPPAGYPSASEAPPGAAAAGPAVPGEGSGTGPHPVPAPAPASGLIDSVPWRTGGVAPVPAPPVPSVPALGTPPAFPPPPAFQPPSGTEAPLDSGHAPAVPAHQPPAAGTPDQVPAAGFDPDHDGQTVMKSSLPGMAPLPAATGQEPAGGPLVLARVCAQGHANPPTRALCGACGGSLLPDAVQVARPRLGRMRLSTGDLLDLDESMVIGRQPSVSRVQGGGMPRLVQVASPGGDISRSHVEVRLEGWHVMLCDLKATNGTVLVREGQPPRRLAQNEMAILLDGDIAELGDNVSLRFEEIP